MIYLYPRIFPIITRCSSMVEGMISCVTSNLHATRCSLLSKLSERSDLCHNIVELILINVFDYIGCILKVRLVLRVFGICAFWHEFRFLCANLYMASNN